METENSLIDSCLQESSSQVPISKEIIAAQFKFLREILKSAFDSKFGEIFRAPVDPERDSVPNYFDVITSPIDLGTILSKLDKNEYIDPEDCIADFRLMINNCNTFNPEGSVAHHQARELDKLFNKKMIRLPIETPVVAPLKRRNPSLSPNKFDESKSDDYKLKSAKIKKISSDKNHSLSVIPLASKENSRHLRKPSKDFGGVDKATVLDTAAMNFCNLAISELFQKRHHDYAFPFLSAVDPIALGIPDYYDIIKCPMDLGTVRNKLKNNQYGNSNCFLRDVRLVFTNCYRYNAQSTEVYASAKKLHEVFEHFIAACPQDVYYDMFGGDRSSDQTMIVNSSLSRGTRRSQNVESRQIMDCCQSIERKVQQIAEDVVKIKQEKQSKFVSYSENGQLQTKRPSQKSSSSNSLTPLKNPSVNSLFPRIEPQKVDDADPMTYDEKLALSSQIMCLTEPKIKEVIGIIHQKEPWSRRSSQGKDKTNIEFDLESLQPSTLRILEKYVQGLNRKKSENSYRKKCTAEERISREQDLRKKLHDMESQLSGKTPIPIGGKNISRSNDSLKTQDESTCRLSDSSSESDISDDEFAKRYSLTKPTFTNQSASTLTLKNSISSMNAPSSTIQSRAFPSTKLDSISSSLFCFHAKKGSLIALSTINQPSPASKNLCLNTPLAKNIHQKTITESQKVAIDGAATAALTQNSFLAKLGITTTSHSPKSSTQQAPSIPISSNSKYPNQVQIEQLREEERKKRLLHIGKIDINAQGDIMKTFEDKF